MIESGALATQEATLAPAAPRLRFVVSYLLLVGVPVAGVLLTLTRNFDGRRTIALAKGTATQALVPIPGSLSLIVMILVTLAATQITGAVVRRLGQPHVIGEMLAGILLGPSVLGWLAPGIAAALFPPGGLTYLNALGQLGLILFMFLVGLTLDLGKLRHQGNAAVLISHVGIAAPLFLGVLLAKKMFGDLSLPGLPFPVFALFIGVAMGITAFPVLAKILSERKMLGSAVGTLATAGAAVDDVTGWSLLAVVVMMARGRTATFPLSLSLPGAALFVVTMIWVIRPRLSRSRIFQVGADEGGLAVTTSILLALGAAAVTEFAGLHLAFGAFFAGVIMPRHPALSSHIVLKLETVTNLLLLPLFFAYTGLRTRIGYIHDAELWWWMIAILLTAIAGKFGGCTMAAWFSGHSWRDSLVVGTLMNTRGLMELVVLNIGLDAGIISPAVFSMMVLMALITTFMAGPVVTLAYDRRGTGERAPQPVAVLWK